MKRSISNQFLENLKNGALHVITDYVRVDPYLDLELRGNCVMIYYRGGKILTVYPKSVIRISLCRTAKRNPLIFPI